MLRLLILAMAPLALSAAERPIDPTFLHAKLSETAYQESDLSAEGCQYRPLFGAGAAKFPDAPKGVVRFGQLIVEPGGNCREVSYDGEEQIYYVLEGEGAAHYRGELYSIAKGDFMYFAPTSEHTASNPGDGRLSLIVMGFLIPKDVEDFGVPVKLPIANEAEAQKQVVGNHPPSTLYQLLLGATDSRRDLLAVGHTVTSLFLMEFTPGGTNHPHHHLRDEEVYLLLEGTGDMVAGGGMDGIAGLHQARAGDAYYYRPNATVGFYAEETPADPDVKARILAVRSTFPGMR